MATEEKCFICEDSISSHDGVVVKQKGIETLIKASIERKDNKHLKLGVESLKVHVSCRKNYTRSDSIKAALRRNVTIPQPDTKNRGESLRSSLTPFDFREKCLYCTEKINDEFIKSEKKKHIDKRRKVYSVRSIPLRDKILQVAEKRNDKWGDEVINRMMNTIDLVAADAMYHQSCFVAFFSQVPMSKKRGRPQEEGVTTAMEEMFTYLEAMDDCQVSLPDLISQCTGYVPVDATVKAKLKEKYGDNILITENKKRIPTICFRDTGLKMLCDSWYSARKKDEREERLRIIEAAAAIIRHDVQSQVYESTSYAPSDKFMDNASSVIPETLQVFLRTLMNKKKNSKASDLSRKLISVGHAIISAIRPRSFISCVQTSLAVFLYRRFGSKNLITLLSNLGLCSSYKDAQIYEISAISHPQPPAQAGSFCQFIFDNADFNVCTIDGLNTFHSMGGIKCVTPASSIVNDQEMVKISNVPSAKEIGEFGSISIATFESGNGSGLKSIFIEDLHGLNPLTEEVPLPQPSDILWMCGKWLEVPLIPGWKGFMHSVTRDLPHETSKIVPLPFVNSPPSNYDTIYTVLKLAVEESIKLGQNTCFVTFDQPLYVKARDIVAASTRDPLISKISVQVRLGGFHLLMSFLGCIGYIMAGSGLKELLSLIYAPTSVEKMLSGHAYARAVRAHLLTQMALAKIILDTLEITDTEREEIKDILSDFFASPLSLEAINQNSLIIKIHDKMKDKLHQLKENGATAALWIQYFQMVALMKEFIHAERSGNWNDHLCCIQQMIPFFHASGHLLYAKASQLYLQDMLKLQSTMEEEEWEKFVNEGYFTIRRTDAFWSGIWSDMTIEQTLMRSMKCNGGLTRGRGVTDSVLCKWILGTTATHNICASLEDFSGLLFSTVEQHVDFRESRQLRDNEDVNKLSEFFSTHPPFPVIKEILSLATGVVGDETVNCYDAIKVGQCAMGKMIGKDFLTVKLARKDKVLPLAAVSSSIKIHGEIVPIDPLLLFQRIAIGKQTREELVTYFAYELAPFPLSLFNEGGMRKTKKSSLYDIFEKSDENVTIKDSENIIDGGFLLHRVIWRQNSTFSAICMSYANYIQNHYGENCTVVFDGYSDTGNSTKKAEQNRRCTGKVSADIQFTENMTVTIRQEEFLSNANNKTRLINMLSAKLNDNRIAVRHSTDDADTLIVNSAIDKTAVHENVVIVGEDVDLLVLLIALTPPEKNIYFIKPGKGKIERSVYSSQQLQSSTGLSKSILFLHAFSGCDTTSAIFQKGKIKSVRLFQKNPELQDIARIFSDCNSSHKDVARAGERFFLRLYGAQTTRSTSLDNHRYSCFAKSVIKIRPNIASLPPTAAAAEQHCYRVYQQVQKWQGNELSPELWGWKRLQNYLAPITTLKPAAPETLLNLVFCKCMTGCGSMCGCRKAGMNCTTTCANCNGDCLNSAPLEEDEDIYDEVRTDPTRLSQPSVSSCVDDIHMAGLTESADASCSSSNVNVVNLRSTKKATKKLRR